MLKKLCALWPALLLAGCMAHLDPRAESPVPLVPAVDLPRFMGDWYVIAHIPSDYDREAHGAIENYRLLKDGRIATVYTNRQGGFDGEPKKMTPTMHVVPDSGNALWGVRFAWFWPFLYEYRISHLEPDYSVMVVGRSARDYLWLMARQPVMDEADYQRYAQMIAGWGYDTGKLLRVPQPATP